MDGRHGWCKHSNEEGDMQMLFVKEDSDGDSNDLPSFTEKINSASSMLPPSDDLNLALPTSIDQSILVCYFESFHTTFNS